ncbi:hypothetical protein ACHAPJ_010761 [Fusarium lateritium]
MIPVNLLGCLSLGLTLSRVDAVAVPAPDGAHIGNSHFAVRSAPPLGTAINRAGWKVTCDSYHRGNECAKTIDGDNNTFWHTEYIATNSPKPPHTITVDMGSIKNINSISVLPRQDGSPNGFISGHKVSLSTDGKNWGSPVAFGVWHGDSSVKVSNFETKPARYVRLVAISNVNGNPWTSIAELNVYQAGSYTKPAPGIGQWGPTLDFPLVPVAAAVEPTSGKVLVFSSWAYDLFTESPGGYTLTSIWDPATSQITQRNISNTNHDMFCPGISMNGNGEIIVTGGNNAPKTSVYVSSSDSWIAGPDMQTPRGYQASATTSDGRVFTIGGSWSGGDKGYKNGELYNPASKTWTSLPNTLVKPMLTKDKQGMFRADNHAWLFGWKKGTIFQAGPSTAMNWYYTSGKGDTKPAGKRSSKRGNAPDQMCGNAVMYDATAGKILTFGGSPDYQETDAVALAHIITIGEPGTQPKSVFASNGLWFSRIFHTSVVLPDGTIFITGGQTYGKPFSDTNPQLTPELYNPTTDTFYRQQPNSIVRVYHSFSLLLPDATVINGGGLCGDCDTNHFDAQIYTPAYLLDKNGNRATRPKILSVSKKILKPGDTLSITTDSAIKSASLIRYGTATHTVNTDQRRIPLILKSSGTNKYSFTTPADAGIILPGYWMLFVMNSNGVPSIATTVQVKAE